MKERNTEGEQTSSPTWEALEAFARAGVQRLLQQVLEDEVEQVLGRGRYERRPGVDPAPGYRNGFGKPRRLSLTNGTITLRRPRVRGLDGRFESRLPLRRQTSWSAPNTHQASRCQERKRSRRGPRGSA
jgi:transposase-like protein